MFTTCKGPTSGSDVQMLKRFQKHWKNIDRAKFKSAMTNDRDSITDIREGTIKFAIQQLESFQPTMTTKTSNETREVCDICVFIVAICKSLVHCS